MANFEVAFDIEIAYEDVIEIVNYIENKQKLRDELYKNLFLKIY